MTRSSDCSGKQESNYRRLLAFALALLLVGGFMSFGFYIGAYIAGFVFSEGVSNVATDMHVTRGGGLARLAMGLVCAGVLYLVAVRVWLYIMAKTRFISRNVMLRIMRYGPY